MYYMKIYSNYIKPESILSIDYVPTSSSTSQITIKIFNNALAL